MQAIAKANIISPSGNMRIGDRYPIVPMNRVVAKHRRSSTTCRFAPASQDVSSCATSATVEDATDIADRLRARERPAHGLHPGDEARGRLDARRWSICVKKESPEFQEVAAGGRRGQLRVRPIACASTARSAGWSKEGLLGAVLTGLMVLLFLRDWRSALIVVLNIPLALLAGGDRVVAHAARRSTS